MENRKTTNEQEAVSIAEKELIFQIGADETKHFEPYDVVSLSDSVWRVSGAALGKNEFGAPPIVDIRKSDGRIMKVMLYK